MSEHPVLSRTKDEEHSGIFESINGSPEENIHVVIDMMGGIERFIGKEDIVVIKPNGQWYGHAMTNTNTIKGFIDLILGAGHFKGEIIIAENHHYLPHNGCGWTTSQRNGDFNLNELVTYYQEKGYPNVTKYHWRDGGPDHAPVQNKAYGCGVVKTPEEGDGYVWSEDAYEYNGLKVIMSYPIFTSHYSGRRIDFKNGVWEKGGYSDAPVKFINVSGLNHHGNTGITAAIKNYLGVIDMTCGFSGDNPEGHFNFHYIGFTWPSNPFLRDALKKLIKSRMPRMIRLTRRAVNFIGPVNGAMGGACGYFMKKIRKADLNIIAAEYVGHESRWRNAIQLKAVLSSTDPVALDYYASKYVLLPLGGKKRASHDPDKPKITLHKCLHECHKQGIGTLDEKRMIKKKYDFKNKAFKEQILKT